MAEIYTVGQLVEDVRQHCAGSAREELNWLRDALTNVATTVLLVDPPIGVTQGSYINVDDELMYVRSVDKAASSLVVRRGMRGTPAAAHAIDANVEINARFPRFEILKQLRHEIRSWAPRLYRRSTVALTTRQNGLGYDLTGSTPDLLHIVSATVGPNSADLLAADWPEMEVDLVRDLPTPEYPSGQGIFLRNYLDSGRALRLVLAYPFALDTFTSATDVVATVGLAESMVDLASIGAAWRLVAPTEIRRTDTTNQGEGRRAEEVPPGHRARTATELKAMRDARLREEERRLRHRNLWTGTY